MKRYLSLTIFGFLLLACSNKAETPIVSNLTPTEKSAKIVAADNRFGMEIFQKVNASLAVPQNNTMISPLSISLVLAMAYNGAVGNTKTQMEDMLHKESLIADVINQSYKDLVSSLVSHDPMVELSICERNLLPELISYQG